MIYVLIYSVVSLVKLVLNLFFVGVVLGLYYSFCLVWFVSFLLVCVIWVWLYFLFGLIDFDLGGVFGNINVLLLE